MQNISRSSVTGLRKTLGMLGAVVSEVDAKLKYVWIENPHPDFAEEQVVGKRDDELLSTSEAEDIMALKREVFALQYPMSRLLMFDRSDGARYYSLSAYPIDEANGKVRAILTVGFEHQPPTSGRLRATQEPPPHARSNNSLQRP
jgi:hypothetical protein